MANLKEETDVIGGCGYWTYARLTASKVTDEVKELYRRAGKFHWSPLARGPSNRTDL